MKLCLDITMSTTIHYMRALNKLSRKRRELKEQLATCNCIHHQKLHIDQWQTYLGRRVEDMVELNCCQWIPHPNLKHDTGS